MAFDPAGQADANEILAYSEQILNKYRTLEGDAEDEADHDILAGGTRYHDSAV